MDTLTSLTQKIRSISKDPIIQKLANQFEEWKLNNQDVRNLESTIEKFIGTTWIESEVEHNLVYEHWTNFKKENIQAIHGMTMNERLFAFDLTDRYDRSRTKEDKDIIYKKLLAKR